ncbi:MAG: VCBS repeat-containing protein [Armatimonadetes bacterium]|nr:VCBS repeat-containing protein [Armatimonadota bacterium]
MLASEPNAQAGPPPVRWRHLSSKSGILVPPGPKEQTLCLAADIDRDGVNDFVIGCRQSAPALVWYKKKGPGWEKYLIEGEFLTLEAGGAACDIDGDGDLDILAGGDWQSNRVYWWENPYPRYDPRKPWKRYPVKDGGANQHHDQIFGDFDGDGKPEIIFWNQGAQKLFRARIPKDPRSGPWPYTEIFSGPGEGLAQGDIDGDGKIELLAGGRWFKYRGDDEFAPYVIDPAQTHPRMAVGDINGDGRLEVVMVPGDTVGRLKWYECRGSPEKAESWIAHDLLDADVVHGHSLAVADLNGDRKPDIFCGEMRQWTEKDDNSGARMWLFLGDGKGGFTKTVIATGDGVHEARIADLTGDGRPDIIAKPYSWDTPSIDIWLNEGAEK